MSYHTLNREAIANTIGALGTAANLDFTNVIGNTNDLPVSSAVRDAIDGAISSVYKPSGSKAVSELTSALLVSSNKGNVYNMSTNGTTTADFVEGAGKEIQIGDNVVIVEVSQGVYKFDLLAGMVDLTNYYTRTDTDGLLNNKVDKVTGKGLSTNDYTTAEKDKLTSLNNNYFGTSTGQAALQNKAVVVSADQNFELKVGCMVAVKFDANNTYSATTSAPVTMNVNNTGAKQIYVSNTATPTGASTTSFGSANHYTYYMYDGTYWVWAGHSSDNNTTYSAMSVNELTTGTATNLRTVRADYLKAGIDNLISTALQILNGGTTDQVLTKNSNDDLDFKWTTGGGGGGGVTPSHVGQIIQSTTLDTLAKVQAIYGSNTTWISLDGYVLRGATSGVTPNNNAKDLGSDDATLVSHSHTVDSHRHYVSRAELAESAGGHVHSSKTYNVQTEYPGAKYTPSGSFNIGSRNLNAVMNSAGAHTHYISAHYTDYSAPGTDTQGSSGTNANIPNSKNVYMWERVS